MLEGMRLYGIKLIKIMWHTALYVYCMHYIYTNLEKLRTKQSSHLNRDMQHNYSERRSCVGSWSKGQWFRLFLPHSTEWSQSGSQRLRLPGFKMSAFPSSPQFGTETACRVSSPSSQMSSNGGRSCEHSAFKEQNSLFLQCDTSVFRSSTTFIFFFFMVKCIYKVM